jgi:hypothetical protein
LSQYFYWLLNFSLLCLFLFLPFLLQCFSLAFVLQLLAFVCFPIFFLFFVYVSFIILCTHSFLVPFFLPFLSSSVSERNSTADSHTCYYLLSHMSILVTTATVTVIVLLYKWLLRALLAVAKDRCGFEF